MTILSFVLLLLVIGVVVYGIKCAIAGDWMRLLWLAVGLIIAIIILGALGITLPTIPRL
jgi:hypothetical protein